MFARFEHQEGADRAEDHAAAIFRLARPERLPVADDMALHRFDQQDHVQPFGGKGTANQRMGRLPGLDTGKGGFDRRNAGRFFAHEGARRTGDLVHDGDIAGQQIGELRQKQRRAQFGRQLFVQQLFAVVALQRFVDDQANRQRCRARRRQPRRSCPSSRRHRASSLKPASSSARPAAEHTETLPVFHLALIAALGDLLRPVDFRQRMHRIGRETLRLDPDSRRSPEALRSAICSCACRRPGR